MSSKSSLSIVPSTTPRKRKPVPAPANIGLTPAMRARPVHRRENILNECELMHLAPASMDAFSSEVIAMKKAGYTAPGFDGTSECPQCHERTIGYSYHARHRNGKPDMERGRYFTICLNCVVAVESVTRLYTPDEVAAHDAETPITA